MFIQEFREGQIKSFSGCITQEKWLFSAGSLPEMEKLLGFDINRFSKGVAIGVLLRKPEKYEFDFGGFNQVAINKIDKKTFLKDIDNIDKAKEGIIRDVFTLTGWERLVKVIPFIRHTDDALYPPGQGIPQWILTTEMNFKIIKVLTNYPSDNYQKKIKYV